MSARSHNLCSLSRPWSVFSLFLLSFYLWCSARSFSAFDLINVQILGFYVYMARAGLLSSSSWGSIISSGFIGVRSGKCKMHGNHTHTNPSPLFPPAVVWALGTSLSTSLEVGRAPDVSLQRAFQQNIIDVSASTPFSPFFFPSSSPFFILCVTDCEKIPKTATVTSPICQALRWARRLGHLCCFFSSSFFFLNQWTHWEGFLCEGRALSFELMPTYWKWGPKMSSYFVFSLVKFSFFYAYLVFAPLLDCPHRGDEML